MAVYTKLNEKEIQSIINDYPIGNLVQFKGIQEGIENTNYFIKTKNGKFILTIFIILFISIESNRATSYTS